MTSSPTEIHLRRRSGLLELAYADGNRYSLNAEFLRVHSPSADVRGHGQGQSVLQTGKRDVGLMSIESVGLYAIKLVFSDGHSSGIYSWDYLHELCARQEEMWQDYLQRLQEAGASRDPAPFYPAAGGKAALSEQVQVITIQPLSPPHS
ncbi:MAG: DUF971 domain-containing protein [Pseudomonadota bacterium]